MRHQDCTAEPCKHGQVACPCASACHVADDDQSESADAEMLRVVLIIVAVICAACLALHLAVNVFQAVPA